MEQARYKYFKVVLVNEQALKWCRINLLPYMQMRCDVGQRKHAGSLLPFDFTIPERGSLAPTSKHSCAQKTCPIYSPPTPANSLIAVCGRCQQIQSRILLKILILTCRASLVRVRKPTLSAIPSLQSNFRPSRGRVNFFLAFAGPIPPPQLGIVAPESCIISHQPFKIVKR